MNQVGECSLNFFSNAFFKIEIFSFLRYVEDFLNNEIILSFYDISCFECWFIDMRKKTPKL